MLKRIFALAVALAIMLSAGATAESKWWNILLLGTDNRYEIDGGYSRTDSMIILSVNTSTHEAKLTSLMRDTWVKIPGHGSGKLNAASVYGGPELTMQVIEENFGVELDDYVIINITGMADVIDLLGGIHLDVTEEERKALNKGLFDLSSKSGMEKLEKSGENVLLNGNQAVAFARIRLIDSDYRRTERQRTVLTVLAERLKEDTGIFELAQLVNTLLPYVETNLDLSEMLILGMTGLQTDMNGVDELRLPADGTFESGEFNGTWCIKPNFEKNAAILENFIYGE